MGLLSNLFRKLDQDKTIVRRHAQPDVVHVENDDERMRWAIEKANLTLHYFEKSLQNPASYQQYFSIKVKIEDGQFIEHIWLTEPTFDDDGNLYGVVGNKPVHITSISENQKIGIDQSLISDWMIIENGKLIGGYTIRAVRDTLTGQAAQAFDQQVGLYIDDGVDHFIHNFETPEGAILCLEDAYDERSLEKVMRCKDFYREAKFLIERLKKVPATREIIASTAEALKLSFLTTIENKMPQFKNAHRAFPKREKIRDDIYIITEVCSYPDNSTTTQRLYTCKTEQGWRVMHPAK
ncbi:MAG: YegJ family protein [Bacteroidota bacterium]